MPRTTIHSAQPSSKHYGRLAQRSAALEAPLFCYGSLQFGEVLSTLIGRVPPLTPARANGWKVVRLPEVVYPGLIPGRSIVAGVTISDLTDDEWHILDAFENSIYRLELVKLIDGANAWAYTCPDDAPRIDAPWDARTFATIHLDDYVSRCAAWRQRHESGGSQQ